MRRRAHIRYTLPPLLAMLALLLCGSAQGKRFDYGVLKKYCRGARCQTSTARSQNATFWDQHQRFGFVRQGDRILLGARNKTVAQQVIQDLKSVRGRGAGEARPVARPAAMATGPQGCCAFDVTDVVTPEIRQMHQRRAKLDGPNCFNFCLSQTMLNGPYGLGFPSLAEVLTSPFAREVKKVDRLRAGDIIVMQRPQPWGSESVGVHAAIYVSPRLALTKNGRYRTQPYQLMDLKQMVGLYKDDDAQIKVYRVTPLNKLLQRHGARLPAGLAQDLEHLGQLERGLRQYRLDPPPGTPGNKRAPSKAQRKRFYRELRATSNAISARYSKRYYKELYPCVVGPNIRRFSKEEKLEYKFLNLLMTKAEAMMHMRPPRD